MTNETTAAEDKWWKHKSCPTNSFRWKVLDWHDNSRAGCIGGMVLQQLHTDPMGGLRRVWLDVPMVSERASDVG